VPPALPFVTLPLLLAVPGGLVGWAYDLMFVVLVCPLLIAGGLRLTGEARWAAWLGALSFPLYAVNVPVLHNAKLLNVGALVAAIATLAVAATLTWWLLARERRAKAPANT
jgi:peptidoglycan/LPS O-acetylase OafA/YrhL